MTRDLNTEIMTMKLKLNTALTEMNAKVRQVLGDLEYKKLYKMNSSYINEICAKLAPEEFKAVGKHSLSLMKKMQEQQQLEYEYKLYVNKGGLLN